MASPPSSRFLYSTSGEDNITPLVTNCLYPPPSLLPPFPLPDPADAIPIDVHHSNRLLPNFLITAASLLALSFLLLLLFYSLLCLRRRRRRSISLNPTSPNPNSDEDPDLFEDGGGGGVVPHHVWLIRTVGLDDAVIKSIAAVVYKAGDGFVECGDCSVCLGEFKDGEVVKLLPKCSHAFHLPCIDTWLRSHVSCPLCRAPVVAPAISSAAAADGSSTPLNAQMEIERPNQEEAQISIDSTAGSSSSSSSSLIEDENDDENGNEFQPIRRSVSMDSSQLGMLMIRVESEAQKKSEDETKEIELQGAVVSKNSGKGGDEEMKRSLSSRSGRIFFPRYGRGRGRCRGRSASVLPL